MCSVLILLPVFRQLPYPIGHRLDCFSGRLGYIFGHKIITMATENRDSEPQPSTSSATSDPTGQDFVADERPYDDRRLSSEEIIKMWNLAKVIKTLGTNEQCVAFAEANSMVHSTKLCRTHRKPMRVAKSTNKSFGSWFCTKGRCREIGKVSRTTGTFFENVKIGLVHVFFLIYAYAHKWSYEMTLNEDPYKEERQQIFCKTTIMEWFSYCRESIVIYHVEKTEYNGKIGGPGKVVQIDKSKFGKRNHHKGRHFEDHWVLGMIEDGSEDLRLEVCPDNAHSTEVLVPLIKKHIELGTTILTDCWSSYDCLAEHEYTHRKFNPSEPDNWFVAPDGTRMQRIESQWRAVHRIFKKNKSNNPENFSDAIVEYLWRKNVSKLKKDPFLEMVEAIKYVYKLK